MLKLVGIPKPAERAKQYPHEFSGGMRQRAMIAMALALNPDLLIADEPTTALDVTVQAQILDLIDRLKDEFNAAVVMITHDLGVVAEHADDIQVMYAGKVVEFGDVDDIYYGPMHPYTWGLLGSIPRLTDAREGAAQAHPGAAALADQRAHGMLVPPAVSVPVRPAVHDRGARAAPDRRAPRGRVSPGDGRPAADPARGGARQAMSVEVTERGAVPAPPKGEPLVRVEGIKKYFPITRGILFQHHIGDVHAVDDVDLEIYQGETVGLVGETGCGKSTLARVIMRLYPATAGKIIFEGRDITHLQARGAP